MLDFVLYLLYRVGTAITSALPLRVLSAIGNFMGLGAWLLLTHYRRLAQRNHEIAFANEKAPRELRRIVQRHFQYLGANLFGRGEGFHKPIELLRSGGLIGILGDQHAGDHGLWTPFFGRLASTSSLSGLLAKRTGAAVIAAAVHTVGSVRWRMVFTRR